jgi:hypothetical protein
MGTKMEVTKDSIIGDVIRVIQKYFGNGCFTCPGINMETISFGASMHNTDPEKVVEDLKKLEKE